MTPQSASFYRGRMIASRPRENGEVYWIVSFIPSVECETKNEAMQYIDRIVDSEERQALKAKRMEKVKP